MIPLFFGLLLVSYASCEAWKYFAGQRSERVNASQNKARLLDGSELGIGIPAPKGLVIGATTFPVPVLAAAEGRLTKPGTAIARESTKTLRQQTLAAGNPFGASQKLPLCDAKAKRTTTADRANSISANVGRHA